MASDLVNLRLKLQKAKEKSSNLNEKLAESVQYLEKNTHIMYVLLAEQNFQQNDQNSSQNVLETVKNGIQIIEHLDFLQKHRSEQTFTKVENAMTSNEKFELLRETQNKVEKLFIQAKQIYTLLD